MTVSFVFRGEIHNQGRVLQVPRRRHSILRSKSLTGTRDSNRSDPAWWILLSGCATGGERSARNNMMPWSWVHGSRLQGFEEVPTSSFPARAHSGCRKV